MIHFCKWHVWRKILFLSIFPTVMALHAGNDSMCFLIFIKSCSLVLFGLLWWVPLLSELHMPSGFTAFKCAVYTMWSLISIVWRKNSLQTLWPFKLYIIVLSRGFLDGVLHLVFLTVDDFKIKSLCLVISARDQNEWNIFSLSSSEIFFLHSNLHLFCILASKADLA